MKDRHCITSDGTNYDTHEEGIKFSWRQYGYTEGKGLGYSVSFCSTHKDKGPETVELSKLQFETFLNTYYPNYISEHYGDRPVSSNHIIFIYKDINNVYGDFLVEPDPKLRIGVVECKGSTPDKFYIRKDILKEKLL